MPYSKEELKKIRESLPPDWVNTLAKKSKLSPGSVKNILSGGSNNEQVVMSALDLALEYKSEIKAKLEALDS